MGSPFSCLSLARRGSLFERLRSPSPRQVFAFRNSLAGGPKPLKRTPVYLLPAVTGRRHENLIGNPVRPLY